VDRGLRRERLARPWCGGFVRRDFGRKTDSTTAPLPGYSLEFIVAIQRVQSLVIGSGVAGKLLA
jgi:hypothetical protein